MRLRWSNLVVVMVLLGLAMPSGVLAHGPLPHATHYHDPWEDDDDDDLTTIAILGVVAGVVFAAPVWVPYTLLDQREEGVDSFSEYPYENGHAGFMTDGLGPQASALPFSLRAGLEYGLNFDNVHTAGGKLAVDFPSYRLTFDSGWTSYFERDGSGGTDDFTVGDVNMVVRFVESERSVWRAGIGVNWLADSGGEAGFNFTYGIDYFPFRPVVWSSELDWGTLAGDTLLRLRSTFGLQIRDFELYTGVEYLDIREEHFTTMLFGIRYWW